MIEKVFVKTNIRNQKSDYWYWINQPVEKRLETLEQIREEYNKWKYADKSGFQRVYRIIKQKQG